MNDEALKAAVGRFLKNVSFKAQSEIEKVVRTAVATGKLQSGESLTAGGDAVERKARSQHHDLQQDRAVDQRRRPGYGRPSTIAAAAAMNGSGSDTAARSQTMRAGIIGTSQISSRCIAYSAQAVE